MKRLGFILIGAGVPVMILTKYPRPWVIFFGVILANFIGWVEGTTE